MSNTPHHAVVWSEIPVSDLDAAMEFYSTVLQAEMTKDEMGPNPVAFFEKEGGAMGPGIGGHLYPGKPAQGVGPTIHLAIKDTVEEARERVLAAGGSSDGPVIEMPFGRWVYAQDPDGNSLGLFQEAAS